jgi:PAS domain S-box-containing protein
MNKPLNILIVEDSDDDALLLLRELRRGGYEPAFERVETVDDMKAALEQRQWDLVVSDYMMPKFSGLAALEVLQESGLDVPFIIVSGNIGEDIAVSAMRSGAHDYIIKGSLARLLPAVERELRDAEMRRERTQAEEQLTLSRQRLFNTLENINEGFFTLDGAWRFTFVNAEAAKIWGKGRAELLGRTLWDVAPDAVGTIFEEQYRKAVREQAPVRFESISPLAGYWVEVRAHPSEGGLAVYFHNITERKNAEDRISRLNRLYAVLSKVNEAIIRIHDPAELYQKVCRVAVEDGAFKMAWIGMTDPDTRKVIAVDSHGDNGGYLKEINIYAADVPEGKGPTGRAAFEGNYFVTSDIEHDPMMVPWRDKALANGFRSSAAFPLRSGSAVIGAFTIYAAKPQSFSREEIGLLSSLAENVSFALDTIANEQKRMEAEHRTEITNALLKLFTRKFTRKGYLDAAGGLIRGWSGCSHAGIRILDPDGNIPLESSEGYKRSFLEQESQLSLTHDQCICTRVIAGTPDPQDISAMTPNGSFYSNNMQQFLEDLTKDKHARYRGGCTRYGFNSLAVVPIRYREKAIGAVHLADERGGMLPVQTVMFLEQLAFIIGETVFRFGIEEDLRRNLDELQRTSELLERIFSTTHMLVVYLDRDLNFIRVNRAYAEAENRDSEFFTGKNYFEVCPDQELEPAFRKVAESGEPHVAFERPFQYAGTHDGNLSYWDWSLLPVKETDGSVHGLVLTLIDVTGRKKAEEDLRRANAYNRSLIEASLDPMITIGTNGAVSDVNAAAEAVTGSNRDELIGTDFTEYFTEPEKARSGFQQVYRAGSVRDYALEIRRQDGSFTPVLLNAVLYRDRSGQVLGIFAAARDVTELKKSQEERARLASAVASTAEGVVITDALSGTIQYVNPAFEQITGYTKTEALGRTMHILDSGRDSEEFYSKLREALRRDGVWRGQLINRKKDGSLYFEDCTFSPVRDDSGKIINYVSVKRDVTEKLRLESIAESVTTMDSIGYVFSGVRHEIGNPINSAKMSLNVLQHKLDTASKEVVRDYVDRALGEIGRVEHLLKSLRNYNLYESPELEDLDLSLFLEKFLQLIKEDFEKKGIAVASAVDSNAKLACADPRALQQALLNIMTNAVDALAGRPEPAITLSVSKGFERIRVRVADNGVGMTEKQQQDLFKPFYTSKPKGTGLGLVIVKKMVTRMNGDIEITSRQGEGTAVTILLPEGKHATRQ